MKPLDVLYTLRAENGMPWGDLAEPFQIEQATAVLEPGDGPRRHWDGRPRGSSKTDDNGGMLLAELLAGAIPITQPAYAAAADRQQAALILDSIAGFVERSKLGHLVDVQTFRAVHKQSGASIEILAADASGAYGLRPSRLRVDELCQWPDTRQARRFFEALWTSLPKVPGSVGVITTTAGSPGHFSHRIFQRAQAEPKHWRVSMIHDPAPWIDPELIEEERRNLTDSAFLRLWRNEWAQPEDALVSGDDLAAAAVLDGPVPPVEGVRYVHALDIGLVNDRTILVVAHKEGVGAEERVILDRIFRWQGTRRQPVALAEVEAVVVEALGAYPGSLIADPYQAAQLLQDLAAKRIRAQKFDFTTQSVGRIAGSLLRLLRARRLSLPDDPVLIDELANVRLVENSAGVARLGHAGGAHDDQAVALALACHRLTDGAPNHRPVRMSMHARSCPHRSGGLCTCRSRPPAPRVGQIVGVATTSAWR